MATFKKDELLGRKTTELRKLMRQNYPTTRGAFAAYANSEECTLVLTGEKTLGEVMAMFDERQLGVAKAKAAKIKHDDKAVQAGVDMAKVLNAMDALSPEATRKIRTQLQGVEVTNKALIEAVKELEETKKLLIPDPSFKVGKDGKSVKLMAEEFPIIGSTSEMVPEVDVNYNFQAWNSTNKCGAVEFTQDAKDLIKALMANHRIQLVGPPSVGKTSVIEQLAAIMKWPVSRFNFNQDLTVGDFCGSYEAVTENGVGVTKWVYGPLPTAMKEGHVFILDEIDHAPAECSSIIHSVLEPDGKLVIAANGGEVIKPHKNFRIVSTSNTAGFGDSSGIHPNAKVQDAALLSRFDVVFHVGWMTEPNEVKLIRKVSGIAADEAKVIVELAKDSRQLYERGDLQYPITLRQTMAWAKTISMFGLSNAFALTVLGKLPPNDIAVIGELAQRHLGQKLDEVINIATEGGE